MSANKSNPATLSLPFLWPLSVGTALLTESTKLYAKEIAFLGEEFKINYALKPLFATPNTPRLTLRTLTLREYGQKTQSPSTLVIAPYAGHTAVIADFAPEQSLVATLLAHGIPHVALTDWHSATEDMKDLDIDNYLADILVIIEELGGRVNLIGLCQGGWISTMIAARFPDKVNTLTLAGSPIDTQAGNGPLKRLVNESPYSFYEELVALGGGLMKGEFMLRGWKNMHPDQHYLKDHVDLFTHIDDPAFVTKRETFAAWYEFPIDLPGRWYLQVIRDLFKANMLARGMFSGLGHRLDLRTIHCPTYLLAGEADDITTQEQVFAAKSLFGSQNVSQQLVPGGHIGLFMGSRTLKDAWPQIATWISEH